MPIVYYNLSTFDLQNLYNILEYFSFITFLANLLLPIACVIAKDLLYHYLILLFFYYLPSLNLKLSTIDTYYSYCVHLMTIYHKYKGILLLTTNIINVSFILFKSLYFNLSFYEIFDFFLFLCAFYILICHIMYNGNLRKEKPLAYVILIFICMLIMFLSFSTFFKVLVTVYSILKMNRQGKEIETSNNSNESGSSGRRGKRPRKPDSDLTAKEKDTRERKKKYSQNVRDNMGEEDKEKVREYKKD